MSDVPPGLASLVLKEKTKKSFNVLSVVFLIFLFFLSQRTLGGNYYSRSQAGSACELSSPQPCASRREDGRNGDGSAGRMGTMLWALAVIFSVH